MTKGNISLVDSNFSDLGFQNWYWDLLRFSIGIGTYPIISAQGIAYILD